MKSLLSIILIFTLVTCNVQSNNSDEQLVNECFFYELKDVFPVSAELCLLNDGTFEMTELDYHANTGFIERGIYLWTNNLLQLRFKDSTTRYLYQDSTQLYGVYEYDWLVHQKQQEQLDFHIIKLNNSEVLSMFVKPARTDFVQWTKGRIENFNKKVADFETNPNNIFSN